MTRNGSRLATDAFHHIPITANGIDGVVEEVETGFVEPRSKMLLGYRKPDAVGKTLTQRPRRNLDAGRQSIFRVPRRLAVQLPEILYVFKRKVITREIKKTVLQHTRMTRGQYEPVPVG